MKKRSFIHHESAMLSVPATRNLQAVKTAVKLPEQLGKFLLRLKRRGLRLISKQEGK